MLKAEDISKSFGARSLFQQVSYHFHSGERYALVEARPRTGRLERQRNRRCQARL